MPILLLGTVMKFLPTLMGFVGKGVGATDLVHQIVGSFKDDPKAQATILAEIDRLAVENDAGHQRLQEKLAAAALR